jgi:hypothetical protein
LQPKISIGRINEKRCVGGIPLTVGGQGRCAGINNTGVPGPGVENIVIKVRIAPGINGVVVNDAAVEIGTVGGARGGGR